MAVLPKNVADHLRKKLSESQRPIRNGQSRVTAGDVRAGDDEKERCARHQQRKAMNTLGHKDFESRVANREIEKRRAFQSAIRNPKSAILSASYSSALRAPASSQANSVVRATRLPPRTRSQQFPRLSPARSLPWSSLCPWRRLHARRRRCICPAAHP